MNACVIDIQMAQNNGQEKRFVFYDQNCLDISNLMRVTCSAHLILSELVILTMFE